MVEELSYAHGLKFESRGLYGDLVDLGKVWHEIKVTAIAQEQVEPMERVADRLRQQNCGRTIYSLGQLAKTLSQTNRLHAA